VISDTVTGGANASPVTTSVVTITLPSMPTGWVCPRCDVVNAPSVQRCMCPSNPAPAFPVYPFPIYPDPWVPWEPWRTPWEPWTPNPWITWCNDVNGSSSRELELVAVLH
jgi:hypothetical protein